MQTGYNKLCDWWSLGVIMYEMLIGKPYVRQVQREIRHVQSQMKQIRFRNSTKSLVILVHFEEQHTCKEHHLLPCLENSEQRKAAFLNSSIPRCVLIEYADPLHLVLTDIFNLFLSQAVSASVHALRPIIPEPKCVKWLVKYHITSILTAALDPFYIVCTPPKCSTNDAISSILTLCETTQSDSFLLFPKMMQCQKSWIWFNLWLLT